MFLLLRDRKNNSLMDLNRTSHVGLISLVLLGLLPRFVILSRGTQYIVQFVPDDAFYYLKTAQNIVAGYGSTFDRFSSTNGYHPLWMAMLLPLAAVARSPLHLLVDALLLSIALNVLGALLLYLFLRKLTNSLWLSLVGMGMYFLNPQAIASSVDGLETSISSIFFMTSLYLVLSRLGRPKANDPIDLLIGLCLGLLFLARTDNVLFVGAFFLLVVVNGQRCLWLQRSITVAAPMALVVTPWILWNWCQFGSLVQASADALPYVLHGAYMSGGHTSLQMLGYSGVRLFHFMVLTLPVSQGFPPLLYQIILAVAIRFLLARWRQHAQAPRMHSAIALVLLLWVASFVLIFIHTFLRWYPRPWYFDQLIILSAVTLCLAWSLLHRPRQWIGQAQLSSGILFWKRSRMIRIGGSILLVAGLGLVAGFELHITDDPPNPQQVEMLAAADWIRDNLDHRTVIGAFNAGIIAFFSNQRVLNLDGVMDDAMYKAIKQSELVCTMRKASMGYYVDYDPIMLELYSPFLGSCNTQVQWIKVRNIRQSAVRWEDSVLTVYRLKWAQ